LKKKVLVLGADGMIGHKIAQVLENKNDIIGTSRKSIEPIDLGLKNSKLIYKDFAENTDFNFLENLMPDIIINCVGITTRRINKTNISQLEFINSKLPHILGDWAIINNRKLIHLSTDCVFSGKAGNYIDDSYHDATDLYGRSKSLGEVNNKNTLTIRTSLIGREIFNFTELFEWFQSNKGSKVSGYVNVIYSGVTTIRLGKILEKIINDFPDLVGIYNFSSEPITKYSLLNLINKHFELGVQIFKDTKIKSNKVLISKKFTEITETNPPDWNDLILEFKEDSIANNTLYKK
tara:strand:- start:4025 stop:4900 length:876 start_codon:yes stop_codon:yes gene_type:complete